MGKVLYKLFWGITTGLTLPTFLILLSWNALPGEILFPVKLSLEKTLVLGMTPFGGAGFDMQLSYTERRFDEATRLLARSGSTEGFVYLDNQVESIKTQIIADTSDEIVQEKRKQAYIQTLNDLSLKLESEKNSIKESQSVSNQQVNPTKGTIPTRTPSATPRPIAIHNTATPTRGTTVQNSPSPMLTNTPSPINNPDDAVKKIEDTQKKIDDAIHEVEQAQNANVPRASENNNNGRERNATNDHTNRENTPQENRENKNANTNNDTKDTRNKESDTPSDNRNNHGR